MTERTEAATRSTGGHTSLLDRARAWRDEDPDPQTRSELAAVIERTEAGSTHAMNDLADRFAGPLEFGTAGLRGALGAGPNRMNRAVVIRAAAGLAAYLKAVYLKKGGGTVAIGYDARHKSDRFARDTAAVMSGAGLDAVVLPGPLPTPVLAYAIRHLGCAAGVMVTASHNPPQDNGYKVYLGDGCQIVPPADREIAQRIAAVTSLADVPLGDGWQTLGDEIVDDYARAVVAIPEPGGPRALRLVYTPLHGVGAGVVSRVLHAAGFTDVHAVPEQNEPDPEFSTVSFPNPEEPGAMDLALRLAREVGADVVVANDPDADRCAVGVPTDQGWRMLRGDEVGALLGDAMLRRDASGVYAASIVSSSLLGKMATARGMGYEETLTGFKWIARVDGLVYGYEEALGYCVAPGIVRDKDGISAGLLVAELAAVLKADGLSLLDRIDEIEREYGVHATDQLSVRVDDLSEIVAAMSRLRSSPPDALGGMAVERIEDLSAGVAGLPPTDGLRYRLAEGGRVVVRPSGTEPKLKCYLEVVVPSTDGVEAARISAAGRLDAIRADLATAAGI
ncbi:MAG: phospho-sugar mutase [Propionibacteriales bacterium]|nr:phospho-sugar mutase [Propionibacteriales bacterium]